MGAGVGGLAGIGLKFSFEDLRVPATYVESCGHPGRASFKFCPECGTKVEVVKVEHPDVFEHLLALLYRTENSRRRGDYYTFGRITQHKSSTKPEQFFLGWGGQRLSCAVKDIPSVEEITVRIEDILSEAVRNVKGLDQSFVHEVMDVGHFGFHIDMWVSY